MEKYPTVEVSAPVKPDPQTGGSITFIKREPDFARFTKEHWDNYNKEKMFKENDRLKMYIGILITVIIIGLLVTFGR